MVSARFALLVCSIFLAGASNTTTSGNGSSMPTSTNDEVTSTSNSTSKNASNSASSSTGNSTSNGTRTSTSSSTSNSTKDSSTGNKTSHSTSSSTGKSTSNGTRTSTGSSTSNSTKNSSTGNKASNSTSNRTSNISRSSTGNNTSHSTDSSTGNSTINGTGNSAGNSASNSTSGSADAITPGKNPSTKANVSRVAQAKKVVAGSVTLEGATKVQADQLKPKLQEALANIAGDGVSKLDVKMLEITEVRRLGEGRRLATKFKMPYEITVDVGKADNILKTIKETTPAAVLEELKKLVNGDAELQKLMESMKVKLEAPKLEDAKSDDKDETTPATTSQHHQASELGSGVRFGTEVAYVSVTLATVATFW